METIIEADGKMFKISCVKRNFDTREMTLIYSDYDPRTAYLRPARLRPIVEQKEIKCDISTSIYHAMILICSQERNRRNGSN